ncbi:MAG: molybdopterin-dependent oxidoreductase [Gammaproteobacteria bacterium]|nr:molybdopterin-dependent oxidoreductase [Gammaproteobacteria bacterium]
MAHTTWHKSACNLCYINCGIEVAVEGDGADARLTKIRGDKDNPKSKGYLCNKAQGIPSHLHHRDRLSSPLRRRRDGTFEAIDWDTAIREIADRLQAVRAQYGGQSLALYGGGGQGNHAGGAYATALLRSLGSRHVFNALAQEKTGDFWVNGHLFGAQTCHTAEDIEHCDLLFVLGANPWLAHGFANARLQLNAIARDPARKLIVVDPRRSETAELADLHLQPRPGTDAFLMAALLAMLLARGGVDHAFLAGHVVDFDAVAAVLREIPIGAFAATADVPIGALERAVAMIGDAHAMAVRAELGIQQGRHSTLNSYLEKLLFLMTGNFGRRGTNVLHSWLAPLWGNGRGQRHAPTGAEIIGGLLPPNRLAESISSDHPERLRAVWVDSSNPVNTTADTGQLLEALGTLDLLVVVDIAFTETAELADYVLPACSQYEKCEYTLFTFEYPTNYLHVRAPVLPRQAGTLAEPEIYTRLARALGTLPERGELAPLAAAAEAGLPAFGRAFEAFMREHPDAAPVAPMILYATLGPQLPDGTAAAAPLWAAAQRFARLDPGAVCSALGLAAPGEALGDRLFQHVVGSRSGAAFSTHSEVWTLIDYPDRKIRLAIPLLLDTLAHLDPESAAPDVDYPFVLSAGQRRLQNANQNFRTPAFRRADPDGAMYLHPDDLAGLGLLDGEWAAVESRRARLVVRTKADPGLRRGYAVLPHGYGQHFVTADGARAVCGPKINWLTDSTHRDPIAGTPYHKNVPVRISIPSLEESTCAENNSSRVRSAL